MTNQNQEKIESYFPVYHNVLRATHIKNLNDGSYEKFSDGQKLAFHYVLDRYKFFKQQGKEYFDNQEDIAKACASVRRSIFSIMKLLEKCGYLTIKSKMSFQHRSNSYVFGPALQLAVFESKKLQENYSVDIIDSFKQTKKKPDVVKQPSYHIPTPSWDDIEDPF